MSIRATILAHSLPHLPTHSFTRSTLVHALTALPPSHPDYREPQVAENAIDTIFGPGNVGAAKALVEAWEDAGRDDMTVSFAGKEVGLKEILQRRLEWSAAVGEHLVEAYANLSTPTSPPSIPLPTLSSSLLSRLLTTLQPPPLYSPPSPFSASPFSPSPFSPSASSSTYSTSSTASTSSSTSSTFPTSSTPSSTFSSFLSSSQLALITINPLGPFSYAFRIADTAITSQERSIQQHQRQGKLRRGAWGEPLGAGSEWYLSRAGLGIVYLLAESNLLRPMPNEQHQRISQGINPYLPQAINSLHTGIDRYNQVMNTLENSEQGLGEAAGYLGFVGRSLQGIIRSRGFIKYYQHAGYQ